MYVADSGVSTKAWALWAREMGITLPSWFGTIVEETRISFVDDGGTRRVGIQELPTAKPETREDEGAGASFTIVEMEAEGAIEGVGE